LEWSRATRICARRAAHDLDFTLCLGGAVLGSLPVIVAGSEAHLEQYFEPILRGEVGGLGLTEWAHGSDVLAGETTATPIDAAGSPTTIERATHFRLQGAKSPINNGTRGANLVLLARIGERGDPFGHALFLVARETPGLAPHAPFAPVGFRNMDLSGALLDGVVVPRAAMMGAPGEGFVQMRRSLEISRSGVAAMATGPTVGALAHAWSHARARSLYGAPIERMGGVRKLLARSFARACLGVALGRRAANAIAKWAASARSLSCAAKYLCPILCEQNVADCGTVLGARSLMEDLPFARLRRSAPVLAIFDGSSQLQLDELWRSVGAWRRSGSLDFSRAKEITQALRAPSDEPFDAHRDDAGALTATTPPALFAALHAHDASLGLGPFSIAADALAELAGRLRGAPQEIQFRVSEIGAWLHGIGALAEACASAEVGARPSIEGALALVLAESAASIAGAIVEIDAALDAKIAFDPSSLLTTAATTHTATARAYEALGTTFSKA
jgi:alkylation response protein AidB-like acyl-CoA dehydrogenase